ncbi:MAG: hypothetical protein RLZZ175_3156 [Bacteroidota bacterium]|jgi:alpha-beta hydrolase superfamily lysophospholipase
MMKNMRFKKVIVISLSVLTFLYLGFCILFYSTQENFLFPAKKIEFNFKINSSLNFEELTLKVSKDVQLSGILFKADKPKGVVLHFHGNEQNILDMESLAKPFVGMGYSFVAMDYRTYGKSTGTLSEENLFSDAKLFLELLEKRGWKQSDIILMGHSIGTGIATQLASISNTKALILYAPYYTFKDLISEKMPILPIGMLIKYPLNSAKYMESVNCPVLILHGTLDELVPINHAIKLSKINGKLISIENGKHENLTEFNEFWLEISQFLK